MDVTVKQRDNKALYLVTGGCGFIGSHLVDLLLENGYRVRVIDDLSNGFKTNISPQAEFLLGSVADATMMQQALEGVDGVFHLAAMVSVPESITHWHKTHRINCGGTVCLFEMAKKLPIVLASTAAIYGDALEMPHNEKTPPRPLSPYAVDKLASELHAQVAWKIYGTPSIACRFFNVYGPRQNPTSSYSGVISKFVNKILSKEQLIIYGDGNQRRDFIYVKDIVQMLLKAMQSNTKGAHVLNLCTGKDHTINELADLIGKVMKIPVKKKYAPMRPGDMQLSCGDPSKAFQEMGLKAEISLEEGLRQMMREMTH